jgi:hypothetical protein
MITAITLNSVIDKLQPSFFERRLKARNINRSHPIIGFMRVGDSDLFETIPLKNKAKLIGLLFMHPESDLAQKEILPRFGQYHQRAGRFTDFYFAGYGIAKQNNSQKAITELDNVKWEFSDSAFNSVRKQIEKKTLWKYSGETDLILTTARFSSKEQKAVIDFSQCITCCLEQLLRDKAIVSIPNYFERIFRFGQENHEATAFRFSDLHLIQTSKDSFLDWVLSLIKMKTYFKKNRGLAIRNIAKE